MIVVSAATGAGVGQSPQLCNCWGGMRRSEGWPCLVHVSMFLLLAASQPQLIQPASWNDQQEIFTPTSPCTTCVATVRAVKQAYFKAASSLLPYSSALAAPSVLAPWLSTARGASQPSQLDALLAPQPLRNRLPARSHFYPALPSGVENVCESMRSQFDLAKDTANVDLFNQGQDNTQTQMQVFSWCNHVLDALNTLAGGNNGRDFGIGTINLVLDPGCTSQGLQAATYDKLALARIGSASCSEQKLCQFVSHEPPNPEDIALAANPYTEMYKPSCVRPLKKIKGAPAAPPV